MKIKQKQLLKSSVSMMAIMIVTIGYLKEITPIRVNNPHIFDS